MLLQVFECDGMPRKICEVCKTILGNSYKFKQICKRSDTLLKMYPITGNVPPKIKIPQGLLPARAAAVEVPLPVKPDTKEVGVNCDEPEQFVKLELKEISTQTDDIEPLEMMVIDEGNYTTVIAPPEQFSEVQESSKKDKIKIDSIKILNKATSQTSLPAKQFRKPSQMKIERVEHFKPKILNTQLQAPIYETVDSLETMSDGKIKIVTFSEEDGEYLEEAEFIKPEAKNEVDDEIVYTCDVCERSFPLLQQLEIHRINHTRERNHPCDLCDKSFFTKYDLAKHILTHTKQKDFQCIVCGKSFSRSTLLYRHEKIHADLDIERYKCGDCDREYLNIADYEKHVLTHAKNRPFACRFCEKSFAFKQGLERHEIIHDEKSLPNPCQYCDMRFPSAARVQRHLSQKHAGMRPFPCSKCPKRFSMSHHLYRHMRTSHLTQETASFQCPECEEVFSDRQEFFNHAIEHAEMTLTCPLCKLVYDNAEDVTEHLVVHSKSDMHFCDYCNCIFMTADELQNHFMDVHSEELCAVGEEIEFIVEPEQQLPVAKKRKISEKQIKVSVTKKEEVDAGYEIQEINDEEYDYSNQFIVSDMDGASFVEYEEIAEEDYEQPAKSPQKVKTIALRTSAKEKTSPTKKKPEPVRAQTVRKTRSEIEQLKKEGKIEILPNGEMRMKS